MRDVHDPDVDAARETVEGIIKDVSARAGQPVPTLRIVDKLRGGATNTSQATVKGAGSIRLPAEYALFLTRSLSRDAVEHLMAHELAHIVLLRSGWGRACSWLQAGLFVLGAAGIVAVVAAGLSGDRWAGFIALALFALLVLDFLVIPSASRKHERECDVFAARLQAHLEGATELMRDYERRRTEHGRARPRWFSPLVDTHPQPAHRLSIMRAALAPTSTSEARGTIGG